MLNTETYNRTQVRSINKYYTGKGDHMYVCNEKMCVKDIQNQNYVVLQIPHPCQ